MILISVKVEVMQKLGLVFGILTLVLTGCSTVSTSTTHNDVLNNVRDPNCKVNQDIQRNATPKTPYDMSLPSFGQGVIGWATGPEGAKSRLDNVQKSDIQSFKDKGTTLEMVKEWQAFYENEVKRNPCNPTAPYRAELMKKIATLWVE